MYPARARPRQPRRSKENRKLRRRWEGGREEGGTSEADGGVDSRVVLFEAQREPRRQRAGP
eukprot:3042857-Rhodomonas_salina.2